MWRRMVLLSLLGLGWPLGSAWAQSPQAAGWVSVLQSSGSLRAEIIAGRIVLYGPPGGQARGIMVGTPDSRNRQSLIIQPQSADESLVVEYEAVDGENEYHLLWSGERGLTLSREAALVGGAKQRIVYTQPVAGDVSLSFGSAPHETISAASLWHLLLTPPYDCRDYLSPLLEALRHDWQAAILARDLEDALFAAAPSDIRAGQQLWRKLVDELRSDHFQRRQAADHRLQSAGYAVVPFLKQLDRRGLAIEQQRRIQSICASLEHPLSDTPERAAAWLLADKPLWAALLAHPRLAQRQVAARQLSLLCDGQIAFDSEAEPDVRQAQQATIARRLQAR